MSEMLKHSEAFDFINAYAAAPDATRRNELFMAFCDRIGDDRDAIRAETREELLKDHFKIGEQAIGINGERLLIVGWRGASGSFEHQLAPDPRIRRPPKKRALRPNEIQDALVKFVRTCDQETFHKMVVASGIPTEVEE